MLIQRAELLDGRVVDVRLARGRIAAIGDIQPEPGEPALHARGGLLIPGLHDHHIHLAASAAARRSVFCGPPSVTNLAELAAALDRPGNDWLRGVGYHESVAGMLDRDLLDDLVGSRPLRIQHRSGRMWFFNSAGLDRLLALAEVSAGLERERGRWTGRLFDSDHWLREVLSAAPPMLDAVAAELARCGVTGVTDMTPSNDLDTVSYFAVEQATGRLPQRTIVAGTSDLKEAAFGERLSLGPVKLHLHEANLPAIDAAEALVSAAHRQSRAVAIHCVSEVELVFALAALRAAGPMPGDRIEHAGIAPDSLVEQVAELGLTVVSQPHFITERGDQYLDQIDTPDHPHLYRLAAFDQVGVSIAAGSDAPFGSLDPWSAMRSAVHRRTRAGEVIGALEALSPERALSLYLAGPHDLGRQRSLVVGAEADLCLLQHPWQIARSRLSRDDVLGTWIAGEFIHQSPAKGSLGIDPSAGQDH